MYNPGIDLIEIKKMANFSHLEKIFTPSELEYFKTHQSLETKAGMFAAKEALLKSLSCGLDGFSFLDISVMHDKNSAPYFEFSGKLKEYLTQEKIACSLSISHDKEYAIAFVISTKTI